MATIETIATVMEGGTITAHAPEMLPRAVIVLDETALEKESQPICRGFPQHGTFRESLGASSSPGNTIWKCARKREIDLRRYLPTPV